MEDSKKKPIMIIVIVASLGIAGYVTFRGGPEGGINSIPEDETQWVKCNNKTCNAEYEMSKREYYEFLAANPNPNPMAQGPMPLTCKECGKPSLFGAIKCPTPDCGTVFIRGEGMKEAGDYDDRCPKCGLSAVEERMKSRTGGN